MIPAKLNPHILIVRPSSMGEAAMTVPVVRALREAHPDLRITILTRPSFRPLFREIDDIGFLDADFKGRHRGISGIVRLWRDTQALGVTHVADLHDVVRTRILRRFLRLTGQKVAVIEKGNIEKRELTRKFRKERKQLKHTVERYRDTIIRTGFDLPAPVPVHRAVRPIAQETDSVTVFPPSTAVQQKIIYDIDLPPSAVRPIPQEIIDMAGEKHRTWIGVAPFASHKSKIYPTRLTYELIGLLSERYERVFIFGGGPYEQEFAEYMSELYPGVFSAIGLKLDSELDLISNLDAMVSMDSPSMHLASLEGTPVVSIWGATHPFAGSYAFGQDTANAVQLDLPCRPCSKNGNKPCLYRDYRCLTRITPQSVVDKVAAIVGRNPE